MKFPMFDHFQRAKHGHFLSYDPSVIKVTNALIMESLKNTK